MMLCTVYGISTSRPQVSVTVRNSFAGAGASVPLPGFGNTLWKGVKEAVDQNGFIGIFMGGFKASAVGICAALVFGYLASWIFEPKMKK